MTNISFPGLGIETFSVNKIAFTIPIGNGIGVRWYGILITLGIILAMVYCSYRAKQEKIIFDDLLDMAIFTVISAIIGARLYYVLFSLDQYDSFLDVIAIWNGGLAIYGGIIGGAIAIFFVCRHKKINALKAFDMVSPAVMIGQIVGRWGNFFNGEAFGSQIAESEFLYFIRMGLSHGEGTRITRFYHPTFLYESLWNLVGFLIINALYKKKKFDGQIFLMYLTWYGFGRMFIESLRTDSLYIGVFRVSQIVGFVCFIVGLVLLIVNFEKTHRKELASESYESVYTKFTKPSDELCETEESTEEVSENEETEVEEAEPDIAEEERNADISDKLKNLFDDEN